MTSDVLFLFHEQYYSFYQEYLNALSNYNHLRTIVSTVVYCDSYSPDTNYAFFIIVWYRNHVLLHCKKICRFLTGTFLAVRDARNPRFFTASYSYFTV